jgi:GTP cyclohydrolase IA
MNNGNNHQALKGDLKSFIPMSPGMKDIVLSLPSVVPHAKADRLEQIVKELMVELGLDLNDQHLRETPKRVARFYREFTKGHSAQPAEILKTFNSHSSELIVLSSIDFYSLCPHHLLVYGGKIHFAYTPNGRIVGISKIPRLVHALAARPVVQEDLVSDIADAFMSVVKPLGCAVKAIGTHDCVTARGVQCRSAAMSTVALRGIFKEKESLCRAFDQAIAEGSKCVR